MLTYADVCNNNIHRDIPPGHLQPQSGHESFATPDTERKKKETKKEKKEKECERPQSGHESFATPDTE